MPDPLAHVGVVIVTYASASVIDEALRALPTTRLAHVVVVDNASPDDTREHVRRVAGRGVRLLAQDANRGFGAGCNAGTASLKNSRYVLFLNPDAVISSGDLVTLVAYLESHPRCAIVGPRLRDASGPLSSCGGRATLSTELRYAVPRRLVSLFPERRFDSSYAESGPVGYVEGACFLTRLDALIRVGGFDESYFLFFEEHDLAERLRVLGWSVDLCANAWASHGVGASRSQVPHAARPEYVASTVRFLTTHRGRTRAAAYRIVAGSWWWLQSVTGRMDRARVRALRAALRHDKR